MPLHKGKRTRILGRDLTPLAVRAVFGAGLPPSPQDDCVKWRKRARQPLSASVGLVKTKLPRLGRRHAGQAGWGWVRAAPLIGAGAPAAESKMRGFPAKRGLKSGLFLACVLTAGLSLAACSDLDNMFGDDNSDISASDAAAPTAAGAAATPAPTAEAPPPAGGRRAGRHHHPGRHRSGQRYRHRRQQDHPDPARPGRRAWRPSSPPTPSAWPICATTAPARPAPIRNPRRASPPACRSAPPTAIPNW